MTTRIEILSANELSESHWAFWRDCHLRNPALDSPYFHPQFVRELLDVGRRVRVAVVSAAGHLAALFPFEQNRSVGCPAGWPMCDFQSPIGMPSAEFDLEEFMRASGLQAYLFDHILAARQEFLPFFEQVMPSPYMEVASGLEGYKSRLTDSNKLKMRDTERNKRKAARELGPLRLEFLSTDAAMLEQLIAWKREQYARSGADDFLGRAEPRAYLFNLLRLHDPEFRGVLSGLWAGERLLAIHMGMMARGILHYWFPAYDRNFANYSPGRLMLAKFTEEAAAHGLSRIDLGKGEDAYKLGVMTGATMVAEGYIETRPMHRWLRSQRRTSVTIVQASAAYQIARTVKRRLLGRTF
jgi:CelD/BcsL family acetyltransferase involved in cellulose biosynthesis